MAIDESTTIKTPTAKRTKNIIKLATGAKYRNSFVEVCNYKKTKRKTRCPVYNRRRFTHINYER